MPTENITRKQRLFFKYEIVKQVQQMSVTTGIFPNSRSNSIATVLYEILYIVASASHENSAIFLTTIPTGYSYYLRHL